MRRSKFAIQQPSFVLQLQLGPPQRARIIKMRTECWSLLTHETTERWLFYVQLLYNSTLTYCRRSICFCSIPQPNCLVPREIRTWPYLVMFQGLWSLHHIITLTTARSSPQILYCSKRLHAHLTQSKAAAALHHRLTFYPRWIAWISSGYSSVSRTFPSHRPWS